MQKVKGFLLPKNLNDYAKFIKFRLETALKLYGFFYKEYALISGEIEIIKISPETRFKKYNAL
ncbi:hypothetical protein KAW96_01615 [candidate division WOR-3 bacterium]|nr:hypothetical protein [candidate division WOR-3 bacterium]